MEHEPSGDVSAAVPWSAAAATGERMTALASALADGLDPAQRHRALHPFAAEERFDWGYTPRTRPGLPLRAMSEVQRQAVWSLVDEALSAEGAAKARGVLALEAILQERASDKAYRDPLNYAGTGLGRGASRGIISR
jgi:hypothetical protein